MPVFGMFSDLLGRSDDDGSQGDDDDEDSTEKYQVVARDRKGNAAETPDVLESGEWVYEDERPDKEWFKYEYGRHLDPGIRYVCVPVDGGRPLFDDIQWTVEPDGRARGEEMPEWARELHAQMQERPATDDLDILLVREIAQQEGPREALQEFKQLKALESGNGNSRLSETVEDPTDAKEIAGRGFLKMSENYSSFGEMFEDVLGGALNGASQMPAAGPQAQTQPQQDQPAQQQLPGAAGETPAPAGETREQPAQPASSDAPAGESGDPPAGRQKRGGRGGASSSLRAEFEGADAAVAADPDDVEAAVPDEPVDEPPSEPVPPEQLDAIRRKSGREPGDPRCFALGVSTGNRCGNLPRADGVICNQHAQMDPDRVALIEDAPTPPSWEGESASTQTTVDDAATDESDDAGDGEVVRREGPGTVSGAGTATDGGEGDGEAPTVEVDGGTHEAGGHGDPAGPDSRPLSASPDDAGGDVS